VKSPLSGFIKATGLFPTPKLSRVTGSGHGLTTLLVFHVLCNPLAVGMLNNVSI